jgi:capsular exopolysaccharide synthesis family protein
MAIVHEKVAERGRSAGDKPLPGTAETSGANSRTRDADSADPSNSWGLPGGDEFFRGIYTRAGVSWPEVLAVSSAISGEGKTTLALGLAAVLAQDFPSLRVLLVETDVERPTLAQDFGLEPTPGLADCLSEGCSIQLAYRPTGLPNMHLVPSGRAPAHSGRLLRSDAMVGAVQEMRRSHQMVILDTPSLLVSSDAATVCDLADGTLVVVRAAVTPTSQVAKATELLDQAKLRGVVLNGVRSSVPGWLRRLAGL